MSAQTTRAHSALPQLDTRALLIGGMIVAAGVTVAGFGASVLGAAVLSAARDWAQSEQRRELTAKARLASAAAAQAWRGQPQQIVLPDARTPVATG